MSWVLRASRAPLVPNCCQTPQGSAERPAGRAPVSAEQLALNHTSAGPGNRGAVVHIFYDCATGLCIDVKLIKMPEFALANSMFLGREHPLLQNATTGLRLFLGLGRPCFRKLPLGRSAHPKDRRCGIKGNHVFVTHGCPTLGDVLPPSLQDLSDNFVAAFGQSDEDLTKC